MENDNQQERQTPGVYIDELNAFPGTFVPAQTAIPAFIGYTPQASFDGKSFLNKAVPITSFAEFQQIYCFPNQQPPSEMPQQYSPQYYLVPQKSQPETGDYMLIDGTYYSILPDPATIYYFYNSIRLFFQNGGETAYIVSVGTYGKPSGKPMNLGDPLINSNVLLNDLQTGLSLLLNQPEPTMYVVPEATLLSTNDNATLMQSMLLQCERMQTAISIFDVIGGNNPDPQNFMDDIETFRNNTGANGLKYGTCYYPFLGTTIMQSTDLNFTNLFGGDVSQLQPLLNPSDNPNPSAQTVLTSIQQGNSGLTTTQLNNALLNASPVYTQIMQHVLADANVLPPSSAMAGVITLTDNQSGPWQAPANTSIVGAVSLPIRLNDTQQAFLNIDAVSGKSINAIRFFTGQGILIWGARTLDGNSQDWRYLSVRRTMTYLEQSCKLAAHSYIFSPNNANTWAAVKSMISSFLTSVWKEGGLQGAKPSDAFSVECGLGTTMTSDDILNGFLNVTVKVAIVRPAEFIVITIQQQQAVSS